MILAGSHVTLAGSGVILTICEMSLTEVSILRAICCRSFCAVDSAEWSLQDCDCISSSKLTRVIARDTRPSIGSGEGGRERGLETVGQLIVPDLPSLVATLLIDPQEERNEGVEGEFEVRGAPEGGERRMEGLNG